MRAGTWVLTICGHGCITEQAFEHGFLPSAGKDALASAITDALVSESA